MIHIGFTGTQKGMYAAQKVRLRRELRKIGPNFFFHHGDCIGADAEAHIIALECGGTVTIHPPDNPSKRAFCVSGDTREPKPYLKRNHNIVDECDWLFAAPEGPEKLRSGTWATIRYARKMGRNVTILGPSK